MINEPLKKVELASTTTDIRGFYVIAGSFWPNCDVEVHYRLRLYDDRRATYVLNETEIPQEYVTLEKDGVKFFEKDLVGEPEVHSQPTLRICRHFQLT